MANTVGGLIVYGVSERHLRTLADDRQDRRSRTTHLLALCDRGYARRGRAGDASCLAPIGRAREPYENAAGVNR